MFDFQSFDAMIPPRSTWLPRPRVIDGHRLSMTENPDGTITLHDVKIIRDSIQREPVWGDELPPAPRAPTPTPPGAVTVTTAPRPRPRPRAIDPLINQTTRNER